MDELAVACGIDPIVLRERNEPDVDPESGLPFGNRRLLDCLAGGAERFGWADRPAVPVPRATATGGSAPASPPRPTRRTPPPATPPASPVSRAAGTPCPSALSTSAPVPAPCSPRSPPTRWASPSRTSTSRSPTRCSRRPRWPGARPAPAPGAAIVAAAQRFRADHGGHPDPGVETPPPPPRTPTEATRPPLLRRGLRGGPGPPRDR